MRSLKPRRGVAGPMRALAPAVLLLALPFAHAGTPEDPEVVDPAGDAVPPAGCADLVAVWAQRAEDGTLTFVARVASCMEPPALPAAYWSIDFETMAGAFYIYADRDPQQGWGFWHGRMENGAPVEHLRAPLAFAPGEPGTLTMAYPPEIASLPTGDELRFVQIVAGAYTSFQNATRFDEAVPSRTLAAPGAEGQATSEAERVVPDASAGIALGLASVVLSRTSPRRAQRR